MLPYFSYPIDWIGAYPVAQLILIDSFLFLLFYLVANSKPWTPALHQRWWRGGLLGVDQVDPSTLYGSEEDKMLLAALPELNREQILADHVEKIKKCKGNV